MQTLCRLYADWKISWLKPDSSQIRKTKTISNLIPERFAQKSKPNRTPSRLRRTSTWSHADCWEIVFFRQNLHTLKVYVKLDIVFFPTKLNLEFFSQRLEISFFRQNLHTLKAYANLDIVFFPQQFHTLKVYGKLDSYSEANSYGRWMDNCYAHETCQWQWSMVLDRSAHL